MNKTIRIRSHSACPSCGFSKSSPTKEGLSYTPAELMEYSNKGIPVSATNVGNFYDGDANPSFDLPSDMTRGVDIVSLWESQIDSRFKLSRAHTKDVELYG